MGNVAALFPYGNIYLCCFFFSWVDRHQKLWQKLFAAKKAGLGLFFFLPDWLRTQCILKKNPKKQTKTATFDIILAEKKKKKTAAWWCSGVKKSLSATVQHFSARGRASGGGKKKKKLLKVPHLYRFFFRAMFVSNLPMNSPLMRKGPPLFLSPFPNTPVLAGSFLDTDRVFRRTDGARLLHRREKYRSENG